MLRTSKLYYSIPGEISRTSGVRVILRWRPKEATVVMSCSIVYLYLSIEDPTTMRYHKEEKSHIHDHEN
jgi:hypothetical protein